MDVSQHPPNPLKKQLKHLFNIMAKTIKTIIGLAGKKRSGKTSAAQAILEIPNRRMIRVGFADPIKSEVAKIFGRTQEQEKSVIRPVYQAVGEAAKKLYGEDYWRNLLVDMWKTRLSNHYDYLIIDDVRFPEEAKMIKEMGGQVWRVLRPETDNHGDNHISETEVDKIKPTLTLTNEKKLENFIDQVLVTFNNQFQ